MNKINKLWILIVEPHVVKDSAIFINNARYRLNADEQNKAGLRKAINIMFEALRESKVTEIVANSTLFGIQPKTVQEVACIDNFFLKFEHASNWYKGETLSKQTLEEVREVIGLITWLESEHFTKCHSTKTCIICKKTHHGRGTGQIVGGVNLGPGPSSGTREIYSFSGSGHCLNPDCLSHEIEKMIDPDYEIPKEAFEDRVIEESELAKTIREALKNQEED